MNLSISKKKHLNNSSTDWYRQGIYSFQIILNSLVGYLFNRLLAYHFGISAAKSGFDIAFSVPFIIMSLSGFSFLYAIIGTLFSKMLANQSPGLDNAFSSLLNVMLIFGILLMIICTILSGPLTALLAPGLPQEVKNQTRILILLMIPLVLTLGISTYLGGIFTAYKIPISTEFGLLISRFGFIIYGLCISRNFSLNEVALVLLSFSIVSLIIEFSILSKKTDLKYRLVISISEPEMRDVWKQMLGFMIVAFVAQLNSAYMRSLATLDGPGTVAALLYGMSIITPIGLLMGKSLAFATGPKYIELYEKQEYEAAWHLINRCLLVCCFITVLLVILININITHFIKLLYGGGKFDSQSIEETASLSLPLIWSLPGIVILWVSLFPLLNKSKSHIGALIYLIGYLLQICLNFLLFSKFGRNILTWGFSVSVTVQALIGIGVVFYVLKIKRSKWTNTCMN